MVVGGAPVPAHPVDAAVRVARLALDMVDFVQGYTDPSGLVVRIRIGMSTGDVTATVMVGRGGGRKRCRFVGRKVLVAPFSLQAS